MYRSMRRDVRSHNAPSVNEYGWRAGHVELPCVRDAGIHGVGSFLGGETAFEGRLVQTGLPGEVHALSQAFAGRDERPVRRRSRRKSSRTTCGSVSS